MKCNQSSLIVGTRGSPLALVQTHLVLNQLDHFYPHLKVETLTISTTGDQILDRPLADLGGKGLFSKEIESVLLEGNIDLAVHSLKDMEAIMPKNLIIGAVLERSCVEDVLLSWSGKDLWSLPSGSIIGTCSPRRMAQLHAHRPDLIYVMMRGNVQTRLQKLDNKIVDALILAHAGLKRLNLEHRITMIIPTTVMLPAVGQGVIAIQCREDDKTLGQTIAPLNHASTDVCSRAERSFLLALGGTCHTPIGGYATQARDGTLTLRGMMARTSLSEPLYEEKTGKDPYQLGQQVALGLQEKANYL